MDVCLLYLQIVMTGIITVNGIFAPHIMVFALFMIKDQQLGTFLVELHLRFRKY